MRARPNSVNRSARFGQRRQRMTSNRTVIYAGGGVHASSAYEPLAALAEHLQAAVVQSPEGKGAVSDRSDLSVGATLSQPPTRQHVQSADTVLAVGSRLAMASFEPDQQVIQIDVDETEIAPL